MLQETVENKNAKPGNRDLAFDAIVKVGDFNGRDDWYFSLLEDETLADLQVNGQSYTGLTTLLRVSPPEKYLSKMIELVGSNNQNVRNAAVRNLGTFLTNRDGIMPVSEGENPEIIKALLPWLENPKWAKDFGNTRQQLVIQLSKVKLPESVPGLISVLSEKSNRKFVNYGVNAPVANIVRSTVANAVSKVANAAGVETEIEYFPLRIQAISALANQKDMRAITPLRTLLPDVEQYERMNIIRALLECNGFSINEQVQALEVAAKNENKLNEFAANTVNTASGAVTILDSPKVYYPTNTIYNGGITQPYNPSMIPAILGNMLTGERDVDEDLVTAAIERILVLEKTTPKIAVIMRNFVKNWNGKGVNSLMLKDLKKGSIDINSVIKLLTLRKELREKQSNEVFDIRGGSNLALGISACILEDNNEYDALLAGNNEEAKTAMLGCAKLLRANLPIKKVAENLKSPNKMLALAAERFLESEDSPQARQIVLSLHPNEAKVLGARNVFSFTDGKNGTYAAISNLFADVLGETDGTYLYNEYFPKPQNLAETEKRLQKEVKENAELIGAYAYDNYFIRMYKDKAVFSWEEDSARYRERTLNKEEFSNLTSYLSYNRVDELPPFNANCPYCEGKELLMLGKQGGRRVFVQAEKPQKFFVELDKIFEDMQRPPAKLHYWLEKYVSGLEVLFEDDNLEAVTIWKSADEVKLLVKDLDRRDKKNKELQKQSQADELKMPSEYNSEVYEKMYVAAEARRKQRENEEFSWYKLENNKLGSIIGQPAEVEFLPKKDNSIETEKDQWKARTTNVEVRTDHTALYKIVRGQSTKLKTGNYSSPVITPNGTWVIASKFDDEQYIQSLVKINLQTGKEIKLKSPEVPQINAEVFVPAINKVIVFAGNIYGGRDEDYESEENEGEVTKDGKYYLLDVETGVFQEAKGEVSPLTQQTYRPLQPTGNPNEFWSAIKGDNYTEFGRYDAKLLKFKPLIKLPEIEFESMEMYADEKEAKIYFVYEGHLLRIPMPKDVKK